MNYDLSSVQTILPDAPSATRRPFLTPLPEPGHFLLVIDNTGLEKIKRCHMAARNYLILGREPHAKNAALAFGGALHEGLELFHKEQYWKQPGVVSPGFEQTQEHFDTTFSAAAQDQAILRYFTENPAPPDEYRTPTTALEVLKHYRHRSNELLFPDYEWEILADEKGPLIERSFELPLGVLEVNVRIPSLFSVGANTAGIELDETEGGLFVSHIHLAWSGRIDIIVRVNGRIRVGDHKTTSIVGDQFIQSFQLASQTIGYVWASQQLWPILHPTGFVLNAIALKKPAKGLSLMDRGPRGGEPALSFFRSYFDYDDQRIADWQEDTVCTIEDFIHSLVRGRFPLNDRHCFDKFGQCPYHSVCTFDDPAVREKLLQSDAFRQVTWNPVAH